MCAEKVSKHTKIVYTTVSTFLTFAVLTKTNKALENQKELVVGLDKGNSVLPEYIKYIFLTLIVTELWGLEILKDGWLIFFNWTICFASLRAHLSFLSIDKEVVDICFSEF